MVGLPCGITVHKVFDVGSFLAAVIDAETACGAFVVAQARSLSEWKPLRIARCTVTRQAPNIRCAS